MTRPFTRPTPPDTAKLVRRKRLDGLWEGCRHYIAEPYDVVGPEPHPHDPDPDPDPEEAE